MTEAEHRKALLLAKIDAQRTIFRLELRVARSGFRPWNALLSLLGLQGAVGSTLAALVDDRGGRTVSIARLIAVVVASAMSLFGARRARETPPAEDA